EATPKSDTERTLKASEDSILEFRAFGRQFRARLERNDLLLRRLSAEARSRLRGTAAFRGELIDVPGSWVRLTRHGAEITGAIWDGVEMYAIDPAARLRPLLKSFEPSVSTAPIIYRSRDTA